jgi:hypothetical protein
MDSAQKRQRERRKLDKQREKEARRKDQKQIGERPLADVYADYFPTDEHAPPSHGGDAQVSRPEGTRP